VDLEVSTDLVTRASQTGRWVPAADQTDVPAGFVRQAAAFDLSEAREFIPLKVYLPPWHD
jgi:hypothetical protein